MARRDGGQKNFLFPFCLLHTHGLGLGRACWSEIREFVCCSRVSYPPSRVGCWRSERGGRGLANFFCSPLHRAKLAKLGRREAQRGEKEAKGLFMLRQKCLQHSPAKKRRSGNTRQKFEACLN